MKRSHRLQRFSDERLLPKNACLSLAFCRFQIRLIQDGKPVCSVFLLPAEMRLLEEILRNYPRFCPYEQTIRAYQKALIPRLSWFIWNLFHHKEASKQTRYMADLRLVKKRLQKCDRKMQGFQLHIGCILESGFALIAARPAPQRIS